MVEIIQVNISCVWIKSIILFTITSYLPLVALVWTLVDVLVIRLLRPPPVSPSELVDMSSTSTELLSDSSLSAPSSLRAPSSLNAPSSEPLLVTFCKKERQRKWHNMICDPVHLVYFWEKKYIFALSNIEFNKLSNYIKFVNKTQNLIILWACPTCMFMLYFKYGSRNEHETLAMYSKFCVEDDIKKRFEKNSALLRAHYTKSVRVWCNPKEK